MRCRACNHILNPRESTNRSIITGEFLDICIPCTKDAGIKDYVRSKNIKNDEITPEEIDDLLNDAHGG